MQAEAFAYSIRKRPRKKLGKSGNAEWYTCTASVIPRLSPFRMILESPKPTSWAEGTSRHISYVLLKTAEMWFAHTNMKFHHAYYRCCTNVCKRGPKHARPVQIEMRLHWLLPGLNASAATNVIVACRVQFIIIPFLLQDAACCSALNTMPLTEFWAAHPVFRQNKIAFVHNSPLKKQ